MTTTTPSPTHRSEMMFLGKECNHPACHLHDFLPFECPACHLPFCQPHFLPSQHSCTSPLPLSMVDRIAPKCPMCDEIVKYTSSSNMDPNEAVERHILSGTCTGFQGGEERKKLELKRKKMNGEICWRKGCNKMLVVKMRCEQCNHLFCPTHRHSSSHTCTPSNTPSSSNINLSSQPQPQSQPTRQAGKAALSRLLPQSMTPPVASSSSSTHPKPIPAVKVTSASSAPAASDKPLDAKAAAAAGAIKRAGQDVKVPFVKTKTEKRSQAELNSTIQALKARHDKGLLSKTEEVKYAELVAERESSKRKFGGGDKSKNGGKEKGDCIIA
ncbi:hypothetical protein I302_104948 [Kwoniella bestiolae CBS 10118]|uniref:AN1-type domain-containing protein n=1 Tax=Kwoniella bestiolae CBS 10118 TaxID=1296100 RepID=A0A1B9FRA7_9TREE|nr:hypothetical protein I302_08982 [Kwoniella bestiolae CBS 10118]OCF21309.1 hypothetical protein I302_08982 [Kwoniella bestiolae CBS 10118]